MNSLSIPTWPLASPPTLAGTSVARDSKTPLEPIDLSQNEVLVGLATQSPYCLGRDGTSAVRCTRQCGVRCICKTAVKPTASDDYAGGRSTAIARSVLRAHPSWLRRERKVPWNALFCRAQDKETVSDHTDRGSPTHSRTQLSHSGPTEVQCGLSAQAGRPSQAHIWEGISIELPGQDSNLDKESQNLLCYRYTTG